MSIKMALVVHLNLSTIFGKPTGTAFKTVKEVIVSSFQTDGMTKISY